VCRVQDQGSVGPQAMQAVRVGVCYSTLTHITIDANYDRTNRGDKKTKGAALVF